MSKSKGNLVLVSRLRADGVHPVVVRLALLAHHYRSDWTFDTDPADGDIARAQARMDRWHAAFSGNGGPAAERTVQEVREALADDLDAPAALAAIDRWVHEALTRGGDDEAGPGIVSRAANALLGIRF